MGLPLARLNAFSAKPDVGCAGLPRAFADKGKAPRGTWRFSPYREQSGGGPHSAEAGCSRGQKHRAGSQVLQVAGMAISPHDNRVIAAAPMDRGLRLAPACR